MDVPGTVGRTHCPHGMSPSELGRRGALPRTPVKEWLETTGWVSPSYRQE